MTPLEKRKAELKAFIGLQQDSALTAGFDHPCRQTCSGWTQGRERGRLDATRIAEDLLVAIEALSACMDYKLARNTSTLACNPPRNAAVWEIQNRIEKALARIAG